MCDGCCDTMPRPKPLPIKSGQESVWDYPRPPKLERTSCLLSVEFRGKVIAQTAQGFRVLETSHPPVYYFPPDAINMDYLKLSEGSTNCEWKGSAQYFDALVDGQIAKQVAWRYLQPVPAFELIKGYVAFYAGRVDNCYVDGEPVEPQPGNFYGGWITSTVVGPFKGIPGSWGW